MGLLPGARLAQQPGRSRQGTGGPAGRRGWTAGRPRAAAGAPAALRRAGGAPVHCESARLGVGSAEGSEGAGSRLERAPQRWEPVLCAAAHAGGWRMRMRAASEPAFKLRALGWINLMQSPSWARESGVWRHPQVLESALTRPKTRRRPQRAPCSRAPPAATRRRLAAAGPAYLHPNYNCTAHYTIHAATGGGRAFRFRGSAVRLPRMRPSPAARRLAGSFKRRRPRRLRAAGQQAGGGSRRERQSRMRALPLSPPMLPSAHPRPASGWVPGCVRVDGGCGPRLWRRLLNGARPQRRLPRLGAGQVHLCSSARSQPSSAPPGVL